MICHHNQEVNAGCNICSGQREPEIQRLRAEVQRLKDLNEYLRNRLDDLAKDLNRAIRKGKA